MWLTLTVTFIGTDRYTHFHSAGEFFEKQEILNGAYTHTLNLWSMQTDNLKKRLKSFDLKKKEKKEEAVFFSTFISNKTNENFILLITMAHI